MISDNASKTEEASLLATLVMETAKADALIEAQGAFGLTLIDEEWAQAVMEKVVAAETAAI